MADINSEYPSIEFEHELKLTTTKRLDVINKKLKKMPPENGERKVEKLYFQFLLNGSEYTHQDCVQFKNKTFGRIVDIFESNTNDPCILTEKYTIYNKNNELLFHPKQFEINLINYIYRKIIIHDNKNKLIISNSEKICRFECSGNPKKIISLKRKNKNESKMKIQRRGIEAMRKIIDEKKRKNHSMNGLKSAQHKQTRSNSFDQRMSKNIIKQKSEKRRHSTMNIPIKSTIKPAYSATDSDDDESDDDESDDDIPINQQISNKKVKKRKISDTYFQRNDNKSFNFHPSKKHKKNQKDMEIERLRLELMEKEQEIRNLKEWRKETIDKEKIKKKQEILYLRKMQTIHDKMRKELTENGKAINQIAKHIEGYKQSHNI